MGAFGRTDGLGKSRKMEERLAVPQLHGAIDKRRMGPKRLTRAARLPALPEDGAHGPDHGTRYYATAKRVQSGRAL